MRAMSIERVREISEQALRSGALVPLSTNVEIIRDDGVAFEVRYAVALAKKERASAAPVDPFEPFEPELFVANVETNEARGDDSTHVLVLNKFPVMADHVLLITRRFAPQLGVPTREDWIACEQLMGAMNGLFFYNGGVLAGASQEHRHFQLVPGEGPWPIEAALGRLPFRHALVRRPTSLAAGFHDACAELGIDLSGPLMPPLNLLATREWLMVVPRTREHWIDEDTGHRVSVNALGFAGLVLVRSETLIAPLRRFGLLRMLDAITR